jgi:hypothetical protein
MIPRTNNDEGTNWNLKNQQARSRSREEARERRRQQWQRSFAWKLGYNWYWANLKERLPVCPSSLKAREETEAKESSPKKESSVSEARPIRVTMKSTLVQLASAKSTHGIFYRHVP